MRIKIQFTFLLLVITCSTLLNAQDLYYPDSTWQAKKPSELKMNVALIDSAVHFAIHNETKTDYDLRIANMKAYVNEPEYKIVGPMKFRGKPAGIILRNGYIVAQWGDVKRVDMTFSVTKSYLSTIAGLALDSKLIKSVDEPVSNYVEEKFD